MKYKLKEIFDLHMGKTPSRNNAEYWNSNEYKWISIADLSKTGKYIRDTKEHLSKQAIDESGIKLIPANTVIMSFKLSIGKTAITAEDMYSNEAIMAFHDKHVVDILPEYLFYIVDSYFLVNAFQIHPLIRHQLESQCKGAIMDGLNLTIIKGLKFKLPPIKLQRKFVEFYNQVDKSKVAVQRALDETQILFDSLMQKYFG